MSGDLNAAAAPYQICFLAAIEVRDGWRRVVTVTPHLVLPVPMTTRITKDR